MYWVVCSAAIDKLEEVLFCFPDPYFQLLYVPECPWVSDLSVTSDFMYLGSSTSTLNVEVNIEIPPRRVTSILIMQTTQINYKIMTFF